REIHHDVRLRVREIHIVAAGKVGHLRGRCGVVALAAAVLPAHVVPEIHFEGLDIRRRRRRSRIGGRTAGRSRRRSRGGGSAAASARGQNEGGRKSEQAECASNFHA